MDMHNKDHDTMVDPVRQFGLILSHARKRGGWPTKMCNGSGTCA